MKTEGPSQQKGIGHDRGFYPKWGKITASSARLQDLENRTSGESRASHCQLPTLALANCTWVSLRARSEQLNKPDYQWVSRSISKPNRDSHSPLEPLQTVEASTEGYIRPAADPPPKDPRASSSSAAVFPRESPCAGFLVALANRDAADSPSEGPPRESSRLPGMRHGVHLDIGACFRVLPCFHGSVVPPLSISLASPLEKSWGRPTTRLLSPIYTLPLI